MTTEMRFQLTNADGLHVGSPEKAPQFYHDVVTSVVRRKRITATHNGVRRSHIEGMTAAGSTAVQRAALSYWISVGRAQARAA
jgi:hypothetical protein